MPSPTPQPETIHRLAVPVLAGVGNALLQQPMVVQLARAFPEAKLAVFARTPAIAAAGVRGHLARAEQRRRDAPGTRAPGWNADRQHERDASRQ